MAGPTSLIINSAFVEPQQHWAENTDRTLRLEPKRRAAGYEIIDTRENTRRQVSIPLVDDIRQRVGQWREAGWPGVTAVTLELLTHWWDKDEVSNRQYPFYFCQLEAIETLIWMLEARPEYRQGINVQGDGGAFERLCNKMATGSGKTTVMAMIITWQVINALTYPKSPRKYSSAIFLVAPGLTVKSRLQVLMPGHIDNYYDSFELCPSEAMRQKLNRAEVLIENWHTLMPLKQQERSVVKKGKESDEAFTKRVLGKLATCKDLVVINDEAHHAYRTPADVKISKAEAEALGIDLEEATRWVEGLDRLHKTRRITRCYDLSATPFAPTGRTNTEAGLFSWVVSDFGLNDAIEAGLVKTPRVVVRDDALPNAQTLRPKLYHLYREPDVAEDLNRKAEAHEALPALVQQAYTLLGADWRATAAEWAAQGHLSPPVMLTVCNRTETAARVEHYFAKGHAQWPELHNAARTFRVDSKVLEKAELGETATADKDYELRLKEIMEAARIPESRKEILRAMKKEELLRELVDTVGKRDQAGQDLQNVVSVAMLSEGWDAKNVTHIMGLRAFTSQLLCEQVIGRGLRRVAYDKDENGLYLPEFVNVFGVPLSIAMQPGDGGTSPPPPKPSTQIESLSTRNVFEIKWPNILRVDQVVRPQLVVEWTKVDVLKIDPATVPLHADIAPALGGAADWSQVVTIDLEKLPEEFRLQRLVFKAAQRAFESLQEQFKGQREYLLFQLVRLVEGFLASNKIDIPSLFHQDPLRKRILYSLHIDLITQHLLKHVIEQNTLKLEPVFDGARPIGSTRDMRTWYTTRIAEPTQRCQVSHIVVDSGWEKYAANVVEAHAKVAAWVKNDHLGFHILYLWNGSKRKYIPDFLVRYASGKTLVLEIKGEDSPQDQAKRAALAQWVEAVNLHGGFGTWAWDVVVGDAAGMQDVVDRHGGGDDPSVRNFFEEEIAGSSRELESHFQMYYAPDESETLVFLKSWPPSDATAEARFRQRFRILADAKPLKAPAAEERIVQCQIRDRKTNRSVTRLLTRQGYAAKVFIDTEVVRNALRADVPFDETLLPPSENGHDLQIAFSRLDTNTSEVAIAFGQVKTIHLPTSGGSDAAEFNFETGDDVHSFRARVLILHRNRILQVLLLSAAEVGAELTLRQESVVSPVFASSESEVPTDFALVINDNLAGVPGITAIANGNVTFNEPAGLNVTIDTLKSLLSKANISTAGVALELGGPELVVLMVQLANHGVALMRELKQQMIGVDFQLAKRVQVVEARSKAYLPVEFVYAGKAPKDDATLCPNAIKALNATDSNVHDACPNASDKNYVCPAAFWGFSKCIERHPFGITDAHEFSIPQPGFDTLAPFKAAMLAASSRVSAADLTGKNGVKPAIAAVSPVVRVAKSWDDWKDDILLEPHATLLVLLPHTDNSPGVVNMPALEIQKEWLKSVELDSEFVHSPGENGPGPLVLLLGCSTALADIAFLNFVREFMRAGASIVLGTLATVHGTRASEFVRTLLSKIEAKGDGRPFDEILLEVKREMLADGEPFVLSLAAYGHSSWRIQT